MKEEFDSILKKLTPQELATLHAELTQQRANFSAQIEIFGQQKFGVDNFSWLIFNRTWVIQEEYDDNQSR